MTTTFAVADASVVPIVIVLVAWFTAVIDPDKIVPVALLPINTFERLV